MDPASSSNRSGDTATASASASAAAPAPRKSFYPQNPGNIAPAATSGVDTTGAKHIVGSATTATATGCKCACTCGAAASSSSSSAGDASARQFTASGRGLSTLVTGSVLPPSTHAPTLDPAMIAANTYNGITYRSEPMPEGAPVCKGYDFNQGIDHDALLQSFATTGFQASHFARAVEEVNKMLHWRGTDEPLPEGETEADQPTDRSKLRCTIFLGYTSNMVSCGVREVIRFLVQHRLVSCIVTSAGGVEEDFMKCMSPHYMGEFALNGKELRVRGLNRIGNLVVPNLNYVGFENWIMPILDEMVKEQEEKKRIWSPSAMIARFGERINNEESIYYWAWKNNIPVFCPAITDGSIGDMVYFHSCQSTPLIIDIASDIRRLNELALLADKSGQLILGGGVIKHHICNANLMRNGADYSVYINTGFGEDGSDAGASPDEAVSWGKIRLEAKPVKVWSEASLLFPLLVAQTFAKYHYAQQKEKKEKEATDDGKKQ